MDYQSAWEDTKFVGRWEKVLKKLNINYLAHFIQKIYRRTSKWYSRSNTKHPTNEKYPVFVLGSNRSGTQMVNKAIGNSPNSWDYPERETSLAFNGYHLRSKQVIKQLIRISPAPIVTFGCILDSQIANELLSNSWNAKAIWVYRCYQDAVNSSVNRFGDHQKGLVRLVANGELERLGARSKDLSLETVKTISELYSDGISKEEGACLYWYMRNKLYFDLNLDQNSRVYIIQYEAAVKHPEKEFRKLFQFLEFPYYSSSIENIFASSIGKHPWPGIDPDFQQLCDDLQAKLDQSFASKSSSILFPNLA